MNLIGSRLHSPCEIVNARSTESNAVLIRTRGTSERLSVRFTRANEAEEDGQLAEVAVGDVGLALPLERPDVAAQAVALDARVDVAAVRPAPAERPRVFLEPGPVQGHRRRVARRGIQRDPAPAPELAAEERPAQVQQLGHAVLHAERRLDLG